MSSTVVIKLRLEVAGVVEELGAGGLAEVAGALAARWARLSRGERAPYLLEEERSRERWREEMETYEPSQEFIKKAKFMAEKALRKDEKVAEENPVVQVTVKQETVLISDDQTDEWVKSEVQEEEEYSEKAPKVTPVKQETVMISDHQTDDCVKSEIVEAIAMVDQTDDKGEVKVEGDVYEAAVAGFGQVQAEVVRRWEEEVARSPAVLRARDAKLRQQLQLRCRRAELGRLEEQLLELEATCHRLEAALKPPGLKFLEKVQAGEVVEEGLVAEVGVGEWRMMITVLGEVVERPGRMGRVGLVRLVDTMLKVRKLLLTEVEEVEGVVEKLVVRVLDKLGRQDLQWAGMEEWEVEVVRQLVTELRALPTFVRRVTEQVLGEVARRAGRRDRAVQVEEKA